MLKFAQWAVDHVLHYGALQRSIAALATGPLRGAILRTYAASADHMRRLTSVRANAKFADSSAGPNEPWKVSLVACPLAAFARCTQQQHLQQAARPTASSKESGVSVRTCC